MTIETRSNGRANARPKEFVAEDRPAVATDWRHRAACRSTDPEIFFPVGDSVAAQLQTEEAKAVCRRCDAVDQCLQWALETRQDAGVWGAMSEGERRALQERVARAKQRARERARKQAAA